jgi:hypothetical protein
MLGELLQQFTGSPQGDEALQTLKNEQGLDEGQAKSAIEAATSGAASALGSGGGGGLGAIGSALGGLAGGAGGLASALQGGLGSAAVEKIADVIAPKIGVDKAKAVAIATSVIPHIVKFLQSRSAGGEQGGGGDSGGLGGLLGGAVNKLF